MLAGSERNAGELAEELQEMRIYLEQEGELASSRWTCTQDTPWTTVAQIYMEVQICRTDASVTMNQGYFYSGF